MNARSVLRALARTLAPALVGCIALAGPSGCAPLTFSNPGSVDFERYRSVRIAVAAGQDGAYATQYLEKELRESSGFERVTSYGRDETDLVLEVAVRIVERIESDAGGQLSTEYESSATFRASTPDGAVVDEGRLEDESGSYDEALEDALDRVAHRFLAPYRA